MAHVDEEDYEINSAAVFKQKASELASVQNLEETLSRFGYAKDDRIERREMVLMFGAVEKDMEKEIARLASEACFDEAKDTRERLTRIRDEFCNLQTSATGNLLRDQSALFEKSSHLMQRNLKSRHVEDVSTLTQTLDSARSAESFLHEIQRENLEKQIERIPRPRVKYSKRMIELFKAESGLIKLCQYEEAKKVRHMIDKILPAEEARFYANFDAKINKMRTKLLKTQQDSCARQEESLKAVQWKDKRRRELEKSIMTQRLKNHSKDMKHSHLAESRIIPEMSVKPSALSQKRPGYKATGATHRGQQLMDFVKGKHVGEQVHADTLVDKHNFDIPLLDTLTIESSYV